MCRLDWFLSKQGEAISTAYLPNKTGYFIDLEAAEHFACFARAKQVGICLKALKDLVSPC